MSEMDNTVNSQVVFDDESCGAVIDPVILERRAQRHRDEIEKNYWRLMGKRILKDWRLYVMVLPVLLVFLFWRYFPLYDLLTAFKDENASKSLLDRMFVGFSNFKILISGNQADQFWQAFRNTFMLSFYGLIFGFPVPIILALMFNEVRSNTVRSVYQIISYLPKFVSTVVITTLIGLLLSHGLEGEPGILAKLLNKINLVADEDLKNGVMNSPKYFRAVYQVSGIWESAGYGSIVFFAAIISISPTSYEAARMDGANKLEQIRYVVLPGILSTITIMLILQIGQLLTIGYEKVLLLYNLNTYETADVVSTYVSRLGGIEASGSPRQGWAAAADLISAVLSMVLVLGANYVSRKASETSLF